MVNTLTKIRISQRLFVWVLIVLFLGICIVTSPLAEQKEDEEIKGNEAVERFIKRNLPAKTVTYYVSIVGETKMLGPTKIDFADEVEAFASGARFFSPPKWQPRLPKLAVEPTASGIEAQYMLSGNPQISDVFPVQIEVQVTAVNGNKLTFVFKNVEF